MKKTGGEKSRGAVPFKRIFNKNIYQKAKHFFQISTMKNFVITHLVQYY
jgi:hypothetical protein